MKPCHTRRWAALLAIAAAVFAAACGQSDAGQPAARPTRTPSVQAAPPASQASPGPTRDSIVIPSLSIVAAMQPTDDCQGMLQQVPPSRAIMVGGVSCGNILAATDSAIAQLASVTGVTPITIYDDSGVAHSANVQPWQGLGWAQRLSDGTWPGFGFESGAKPSYVIFVRDQTKERYLIALLA